MSDITIAAATIVAAIVLFAGHRLPVLVVARGSGPLRWATGVSNLNATPAGYRDCAIAVIATLSGMNAAFGRTVPSLPDRP